MILLYYITYLPDLQPAQCLRCQFAHSNWCCRLPCWHAYKSGLLSLFLRVVPAACRCTQFAYPNCCYPYLLGTRTSLVCCTVPSASCRTRRHSCCLEVKKLVLLTHCVFHIPYSACSAVKCIFHIYAL